MPHNLRNRNSIRPPLRQFRTDDVHEGYGCSLRRTHYATRFWKLFQVLFAGRKTDGYDAFIDAICVYKECLHITDGNAIKGLTMLLDGQAATWWQGVRSSMPTWIDALKALCHAFGFNKPPHQIFRELFSKEQAENEATELFVANARSLLSRLPDTPELHEVPKLNMVYGLHNLRIRERLPRDEVNNFATLIDKIRPRCDYCHNFGHLKADCRKYAATQTSAPTPSAEHNTASVNSKLVCFGCGKPGYVRSQCPQCKPKTGVVRSPPAPQSTSSVDVLMANTNSDDAKRPMFQISISTLTGLACVDTGAKRSIAGHKLYSYLMDCNFPFTSDRIDMTLADGCPRQVEVRIFQCDVLLEGRLVPSTFMAVPEHEESKTLLGIDFLTSANVVLNIPKMQWWFEDASHAKHTFRSIPDSVPVMCSDTDADYVDVNIALRTNEATCVNQKDKEDLERLLIEHKQVFKPSSTPTPYAKHSIRLTDETPISVPPYRLTAEKTRLLREEIGQLLASNVIEERDSPYAAPVVLVPKKEIKFACVSTIDD
ncbi:uncharacterized protein LOC116163842 [Photinus pyralis]|uniref:uncharacterized protein LOC116163842 n=1 Tax=Photinus pyralis TaxID=7054 RepID=UPI001266F1AA|nr:uncharacterized protein LOC116163842 [Photinus pyralis]